MPPTIPHTEGDQHAHSPQLVELCKRYKLSNKDIDKEVSDTHIQEVYLQLEKWELVAHHLGLTTSDIEVITGRAFQAELKRWHVLQEWKDQKRVDGTATYRFLLEALIKCHCSNSVVQVCELLRAEGNQTEKK